jgi:hypothetical protein
MTNPNFDQDTDRADLRSSGGNVPATGFMGKRATMSKNKPGPAGGLPGKSQSKSRNPGGDPRVGYVKSEGI